MLLLARWSWSLVLGRSTVVGDCGGVLVVVPQEVALVAEQVEQALLEVDGDLLELGKSGEERGWKGLGLGKGVGEGLGGEECAQY